MELKHDFIFVCKICGRKIAKNKDPHGMCGGKEYSIDCCNERMERIFPKGKRVSVLGKPYMHTRYSNSMAVSMSQIKEHKQMHPDVKIDAQGRPGFDTVRQEDKYMDAVGMVKIPQRVRKIKKHWD